MSTTGVRWDGPRSGAGLDGSTDSFLPMQLRNFMTYVLHPCGVLTTPVFCVCVCEREEEISTCSCMIPRAELQLDID